VESNRTALLLEDTAVEAQEVSLASLPQVSSVARAHMVARMARISSTAPQASMAHQAAVIRLVVLEVG